ncbi:MAG: 2-oxoacid:acceptor oxidoreductase family protein [Eubacteriales bacterium]
MIHEIICAGFGGQGVLLMGQLLAYAGMYEGKNVSWLPSYGPEMRGGTANCNVVISDEEVGCPIVAEADSVIVMNNPSMSTFEKAVKPGGHLFINSSLIDSKSSRTDITVHYIPANEIADKLGNLKAANMVMLGALVSATDVVDKKDLIDALKEKMGEKKLHLIPLNEKAMEAGAQKITK